MTHFIGHENVNIDEMNKIIDFSFPEERQEWTQGAAQGTGQVASPQCKAEANPTIKLLIDHELILSLSVNRYFSSPFVAASR